MRFLKEPLFHFILVGIAIFGWFSWVTPDETADVPDEMIRIDDGDVDLLVARFENSWKRPPQKAELQKLIDATVREEVLVREARKLGLDRGDQVIRARLARKMEFLNDAVAATIEPDNAELQAYLEEYPERFMAPRQIAFDQVFLGGGAEPGKVEAALETLNSGEDWTRVGVPSLLQRSMPLSAEKTIDAAFGRGFSVGLAELKPGEWSGPVPSGYGQHLIRITDVRPATLPPFDAVRDSVLLEWRREVGADLAQVQYDNLAARYRIETPEARKDGE